MPNNQSTTTPQPVNRNAERTPDEIQLEAINHAICVWFTNHPGCVDEIDAYKSAQDELDVIAGIDTELATYLLLTLAKDWYLSLYRRNWEAK